MTPRQIETNQVMPLPEPARRGLVNLADVIVTAAGRVEATAAHLWPEQVSPVELPQPLFTRQARDGQATVADRPTLRGPSR